MYRMQLGISRYIWGNHWSITFSICALYALNVNNAVLKLLTK